VYDLGAHENVPYIVSELLESETLREAIGCRSEELGGVLCEGAGQNLERDARRQPCVLGLIDLAHPATPILTEDVVAADTGAA
jgi:hypothetical protein